jgi:hypothetical protein
MRNNKILAAAIASALSLGAGSAFAAIDAVLLHPAGGDDTTAGPGTAGVATYASEIFSSAATTIPSSAGGALDNSLVTGTAVDEIDDSFIVRIKLNSNASTADAVVIKATLSTGTWGSPLVPTQLRYCTSISMDDLATNEECDDLATPVVKVSKGNLQSTDTDSTADFVIQRLAGEPDFTASDWIFFAFDVDDLNAFQTTNGTVTLTIEAEARSGNFSPMSLGSRTIDLARSDSALAVTIRANTEPQTIAVDVAQNYLKFIKGSANTQVVSLGDVILEPKTGVKSYNGSDNYSATTNAGKSGTFTVNNGIFSASKGTNAVFLDLNGNDIFDGNDIVGVVNSDTTATFALSNANIDNLIASKAVPPRVMVTVDGTTPIATLPDAPQALLEISFGEGKPKPYPGKLRHIKDNGTKCTLYNIPDGTAGLGSLDGISVRVTNKSKDRTGTIFGELFDEKGVSIYGSRKTLSTIEPSATVRFNTGEGGDLDLTYGQYHWAGQRAKLVITSDLQDVEIFGLVRNVQGGPNMNVSTGATGNGCVE